MKPKTNLRKTNASLHQNHFIAGVLLFFVSITILVIPLNLSIAGDVSNFDQYCAGARGIAMGNTGGMLPSYATGWFNNPAAGHGNSGLEYSEWYIPESLKTNYVHSLILAYSQGKITEYIGVKVGFDATAQGKRYFNFDFPNHHYRMGAIGVSYAAFRRLIFGISGNIFQNKLQDNNATAFSGDAGAQLRLNLITLSACAKNVYGRSNNADSGSHIRLERGYSCGAHLNLLEKIFNFVGQVQLDETTAIIRYSIGSEFTFGNIISVRAGYESSELQFNDSGDFELSVGLGIRLGNIAADYAIRENQYIEKNYIHFLTFGIVVPAA